MIYSIHASLKLNHLYKCAKCGRSQLGDTMYKNIAVRSTKELKEAMDKFPMDSRLMPDGWHRCSDWSFNCGCD